MFDSHLIHIQNNKNQFWMWKISKKSAECPFFFTGHLSGVINISIQHSKIFEKQYTVFYYVLSLNQLLHSLWDWII